MDIYSKYFDFYNFKAFISLVIISLFLAICIRDIIIYLRITLQPILYHLWFNVVIKITHTIQNHIYFLNVVNFYYQCSCFNMGNILHLTTLIPYWLCFASLQINYDSIIKCHHSNTSFILFQVQNHNHQIMIIHHLIITFICWFYELFFRYLLLTFLFTFLIIKFYFS